jgi:hypothetical protein
MIRHTDKLVEKSKTHSATPADKSGWRWNVISGGSGEQYTVWLSGSKNAFMCSCDWAKYRPADGGGHCGCSHVIKVISDLAALEGRTIKVYDDSAADTVVRHHRKTMNIGDGLIITTRLGSLGKA